MKPQSCKSKGRRLQQKVASSIRKAFPHLTEDDCFSTSMGAQGEDVRLSPAARECVPLSIECKNVERINIWACLDQCISNTPSNATSCLVFSKNHSPVYACIPWDFLISLLKNKETKALPPRAKALIRELASLTEEDQEEDGEEDKEKEGKEEEEPVEATGNQ